MVNLKYYREEDSAEWGMYLTKEQARTITKKLCRHFKVPHVDMKFTPKCGGFYKSNKDYRTGFRRIPALIKLGMTSCTIGYLCHEIGHHLDVEKNGAYNWRESSGELKHRKSHTKKLKIQIKRLIKYCRKMSYWGMIDKDRLEALDLIYSGKDCYT